MTQHTPGPWQLDKHARTILSSGWLTYPAKKAICTVRPYPRTAEANQEGKANARLIAAAPEMLAALKWASDYLSGWPRDDLQRHCRQAVQAAIAKAEGRIQS
jgi:hypothetical protein